MVAPTSQPNTNTSAEMDAAENDLLADRSSAA